jgi:alkylation response protein AidB-like acyl-CoA dehydrogenase
LGKGENPVDFLFTEEQERFRQEVRSFLDKELPSDWVDYIGTAIDDTVVHREDGWQVFKDIAHKLGEKGWLSLFWPKEYGGQSCSYVDYLIFLEEIARRGSPGYNAVGVKMLAPTLFKYGTEEQKERHLKLIAKGEEFWCEGFTEPNAGSDLASLQTKAIKDGNHFIINGQKTWSTFADYSDWCCLLARTDPYLKRYQGISFFLVDLSTPGITVRPINNIKGEPDFGEIFFEDVRVPKENLVGGENEGWKVVQTMLSYERIATAPIAVVQSLIERIVKYIKANPERRWENSKQTLAQLKLEAQIGHLICYRLAWLHDNGMATTYDAAMSRLYSSELLKHAASVAIELLGLYGQLDKRDSRAPLQGWFEHLYLSSIGVTIAAGTSEILRNIIASSGLRLPRE